MIMYMESDGLHPSGIILSGVIIISHIGLLGVVFKRDFDRAKVKVKGEASTHNLLVDLGLVLGIYHFVENLVVSL